MHKLLQADRVITEQQLGLEWKSENDDLFAVLDPLLFKNLVDDEVNPESKEDYLKKEDSIKDIISRNDSLVLKYKEKKGINAKMRKIFEMLCVELEFLVDDKLLKLLEPLDENEQALMKLDSIFKALNVNTFQDIETLATYFMENNNINLNSEYKQYNEKINNKLQLVENGSSNNQNSMKHISRTRSRSHTISQGTNRKVSNFDENNVNNTETKLVNRFRSHTITPGMSNIGATHNPNSGYNEERRPNSSITNGSCNINNSKNSSNISINCQKEDDNFGLIDASDTVIVIKRFLHDQKRNRLIDQISESNNNNLLDDDDDFEKKLENIDKKKKNNQDNKLSNKAYEQIQKDYWERMTNIIDDKRYRLWKIVHFSMQKYNKILSERMTLAEDIKFIKEQNNELKALLRQYMNAKINDELEIPPTQIMLAQAGILKSKSPRK